MSYSQRVQGYQTKFSEELERIKNLVGGVSMRKSFSTVRLLTGKLEPTAPKVAAKERAMKGAQAEEAGRPQTLTKVPEKAKPSPKAHPEYYSSQEKMGNIRVTMETALVHQLPGQPLPTATKTTHSRKRTQKSPNTLVITSAEHQSPSSKENDRFPSPTGKHESPVTVRGSESQYPTKPPRLSPSPTPSISPLLKRRKEEKVVIPTILVEDETKTECDAGQMRTNEVKSGAAEEQSGRLDEEHLSPQACVMELHGCASASTKSVHFKEPPSFQVGPCDQAVIEGQDVVISVKVTGQPKPLIYWLKDKVPVKTAGRFSMREMEDGANEIRIISAQRSDSGLYACKLVNERGTKQEECSVEVKSEQSKVRVDGYVTNLSLYMSRCTCLRLRNMYLIISCSTDAPENYPRDQRADGGGRRVGHV
uniref:Ig-like domain-containing protein n=1 Tax=Hippocampus comes TaxID=109280 RepID=A0A3Q3D3Z3_HIPCM